MGQAWALSFWGKRVTFFKAHAPPTQDPVTKRSRPSCTPDPTFLPSATSVYLKDGDPYS